MTKQKFSPSYQALLALRFWSSRKKDAPNNPHPSTKYFLVKFWQSFPEGRSAPVTVRGLMERFKMTDRAISQALRELQNVGWMERAEEDGTGKTKVYQCSLSFVKRIKKLRKATYASPWHDLIEQCLEPPVSRHGARSANPTSSIGPDDDVPEIGHTLNVSQRLLLVTLLFHANRCGVVRGIGAARLCSLVGFSRDRLQSQLLSLKDKGYLDAHEPGGTGRHLFGKITGVYFLNLGHKNFDAVRAGQSRAPMAVNIEFAGRQVQKIKCVVEALISQRDAFSKSGNRLKISQYYRSLAFASSDVYEGFPYEEALDSLQINETERRLLEIKLDEYACLLLNTHFESLEPGFQVGGPVFERIKNEVITSKLGASLSEGMGDHLTRFICVYAVHQAVILKHQLPAQPGFRTGKGLCFDFRKVKGPYIDGQLLVAPTDVSDGI